MKKVDIEKIFNKLSLQVRSTGHNYGWLTVSDKKIPIITKTPAMEFDNERK